MVERVARQFGRYVGGHALAIANLVIFVGWIALNSHRLAVGLSFDPYPFPMLEVFASFEAILIATFVLAAQQREARTAELRAEVDLHVNLVAEAEMTKVLHLVAQIAARVGVPMANDPDLAALLKPTNLDHIESELASQMDADGGDK